MMVHGPMTDDPRDDLATPAQRCLHELGYSISWRQAGWHECLLCGHGETWHGHGPSRDAAFEHALRQALPSTASRHGFDALLATRAVEPSPPAVADPAPVAVPPAMAAVPARSMPGEPAVVVEAVAEPAPPAQEEAVAAARAPSTGPAAAAETAPAPASSATPPAATLGQQVATVVPRSEPRPAAPRRPLAEILAGLDAIDEVIAGAQEEAGLLVPERQRLLLLGWIAEARALEHQARGDREAFAGTRRIAQRCSRLSKIWWPGSVTALALDAAPQDCRDELPSDPPPDLSNWSSVAAAAAAALADGECAADQDHDEHGWGDAIGLAPRHHRPDVLLCEVVSALEKVSGPIVRASDPAESASSVAVEFDRRSVELAPWLAAASKLRWVRGAVLDLELWAAAIGRLRWLASKLLRVQAEPLWRLLDPEHRPATSWAKELGYDPDKRRRQQLRKQLLSVPPEPDWSDQQLRDWLLQAVDLGEEMPKDRIAALVAGLSDRVLAIAPADFSTRRNQRVRLDAVHRLLRKEQQPAAPLPVPAEEDVDGETASLADRLVGALQSYTRGRTALFVTNRNDPDNAEQVRELLQFEAVDACESKSAALAAKASSIEQERYDFVLAATGFLSHSADFVLKAAARRAGIPYVRVNRGRPLSCARALARELGLAIPAA